MTGAGLLLVILRSLLTESANLASEWSFAGEPVGEFRFWTQEIKEFT